MSKPMHGPKGAPMNGPKGRMGKPGEGPMIGPDGKPMAGPPKRPGIDINILKRLLQMLFIYYGSRELLKG